MIWSLNEVDAAGRKAARGAGLCWGSAEEAGRAARWLAQWGLPGPAALAGVLAALDGADPATHAPRLRNGVWQSDHAPLSPFAVGAALWDRAAVDRGHGVRIGPCLWPVLILPYAGWIAAARGCAIRVSWPGVTALTGPDGGLRCCEGDALMPLTDGLTLADADDTLAAAPFAAVGETLAAAGNPFAAAGDAAPVLPRRTEADVAPDDAARLETLAHRTYAPATEASRLSGAGSGLTDND